MFLTEIGFNLKLTELQPSIGFNSTKYTSPRTVINLHVLYQDCNNMD